MASVRLVMTDYNMIAQDIETPKEPSDEKDWYIVDGDFIEGEMVTVRMDGKEYTRRVKYSARKWGDLYITINGMEYTYTEFRYEWE